MRKDRERLLDILEAIGKIEKYSHCGKDFFRQDELVQIWFSYYIQVIGEAVSHISPELQSKNPDVPWRQISAMRNIPVHAYFELELG